MVRRLQNRVMVVKVVVMVEMVVVMVVVVMVVVGVMVEDHRTTCEEEEGKLDGEEMVVDDVVTEMA
jgi:hypothetical protein